MITSSGSARRGCAAARAVVPRTRTPSIRRRCLSGSSSTNPTGLQPELRVARELLRRPGARPHRRRRSTRSARRVAQRRPRQPAVVDRSCEHAGPGRGRRARAGSTATPSRAADTPSRTAGQARLRRPKGPCPEPAVATAVPGRAASCNASAAGKRRRARAAARCQRRATAASDRTASRTCRTSDHSACRDGTGSRASTRGRSIPRRPPLAAANGADSGTSPNEAAGPSRAQCRAAVGPVVRSREVEDACRWPAGLSRSS